jgi:hypothetical protein
VAVKVLSIAGLAGERLSERAGEIEREVRLLSELSHHPQIVTFHGVAANVRQGEVWLVEELVHTSLETWLADRKVNGRLSSRQPAPLHALCAWPRAC